ncbi:MAG: hypothetical protein ACE5IY_15095, partial [bacterium]
MRLQERPHVIAVLSHFKQHLVAIVLVRWVNHKLYRLPGKLKRIFYHPAFSSEVMVGSLVAVGSSDFPP